MTYKQFIRELEDDILPSDAERRYEEYRKEYISTRKCTYFETHKDEEWLKDKYHPTNLVAVMVRKNEHARAAAKEFLLDLQSGTLDLYVNVFLILVQIQELSSYMQGLLRRNFCLTCKVEPWILGPVWQVLHLTDLKMPAQNSDDEADVGVKRRSHGRGPAKENDLSTAPKAHLVSCEPRRSKLT